MLTPHKNKTKDNYIVRKILALPITEGNSNI